MTDLTIGGETFNVLIEGDETLPALMLSNPLGADLHIWDAQVPDLLKHFRIVRYNPRGHRGSVSDAGPYSIDRLGRDAVAILDALGIAKAHWLGMSQGGAVGQWLLINAADRIERAVLANTAAHFGSPDGWNERIVAAQDHGMEALADSIIARWFSADFADKNVERVEPVKQALLATSPEGYAASCAALRDLDLREGLLRIQRPVLVIAGADDASVSPEQSALLAETIPGARLVTLNTRHISAVEDAAGFTKAVVDFLTAKTPARQSAARKAALPRSIARRPPGRRAPMARGAVTDTPARRAPVKAAPNKAKAVQPPDLKKAPAKAPRAKAVAAPGKTTQKRPVAKAAPAAKLARKTGVAATPAKRAAAKAAPGKGAAKVTAKSAAPKAVVARKIKGAVAPAKTSRPKATKAVAKTTARKMGTAPALSRAKAAPARRSAGKPAAVAKTTTKPAVAKPTTARRGAVAPKTSAKRTVAAPAKTRAATTAKARARAVPAKTARKPAIKAKVTSAKAKSAVKAKGAVKAPKAAKAAAKPAARKPAAKAPATRAAPRRKA